MPVSIFGINHKTAPVEVREKVAFSPATISESLQKLKLDIQLDEVAILSTCNRMEILFRHSQQSQTLDKQLAEKVSAWLAKEHQVAQDEIDGASYYHQGEAAISHIMKVASGLDSMVLGEPQILGQVKDAYGYANHAGTLGLYLGRLFQQTFSLAKQVRTDTLIGESAVSVAYAAVTLAKRIFSDFAPVTALFIGAGETVELAARHLVRQGVVNIKVANRTVERAQGLANEFNGEAFGLSALPELVAKADIIISSTASPVPIIGKGLMEQAIKTRKHRPVFMVDLAVPRDIESQVSDLSDVYLYTVDDMQGVISENLKVREAAALDALSIIERHAGKYISWLQSLSAVSLLKEFRSQVESVKSSELSRSLAKLQTNSKESDDLEKIMTELANRLTQKFMHGPSRLIRQAGENQQEATLEILAEAFALKASDKD